MVIRSDTTDIQAKRGADDRAVDGSQCREISGTLWPAAVNEDAIDKSACSHLTDNPYNDVGPPRAIGSAKRPARFEVRFLCGARVRDQSAAVVIWSP